jgi:Ras-related protein Rab-28
MSGKTNEEGKDSSAEGKDSSTEGKQSVRDPTKARPLHNAAGDGSALNSTTTATATTTTTTPTTKTTPKKRDDGKLEHNRVPGGVEDSSSDDEDAAEQFKVILLGDGAVGKTSVAMRFCNDYFSKKYKQTIGLDFFMKRITLPGQPGTSKGAETHVALQIWDIGGQSIGGKMIGNYIHGAKAVLLLYDITDMATFQNLEEWYRLVRRTFKGEKLPYLGLIGNKTDLSHMRAVGRDKHQMFADENDMKSYFLSAKTGDMVNSSIYRIAADLAGVALTTPKDASSVPVQAHIIDHQRHDPEEQREAKIEKHNHCSTM